MRTSYEEDLLTIVALMQLNEEFMDCHPNIAEHAWWLGVGIAEQYGVHPNDALSLLEDIIDHRGVLE